MRIPGWLHLLTLCLLAGGFQASCSLAQAGPKPAEPKKFVINEEFTGYGQTIKEAEPDAVARACQWLEEHSGLGWSPDTDYLYKNKLVRFDEATDEKLELSGTMKVIKMHLEITADQARDMQKQAQQQRMKSRQGLSLLGLIGLVSLIGIVGGYLWLEEATKGYYTRLLRLAAIGLLIVIGLGLCIAG
jgi:hypothetical protein